MKIDREMTPSPAQTNKAPWLRRALHGVGIVGEDPKITSYARPIALDVLRILVGLVVLYDAWTSLSWTHKTEMAQFLGADIESAWVSLVVAGVSFLKLAIVGSLLTGRGVRAMGWAGVLYGAFVWIVVEHGGDFGQDATDPGLGLPYIVMFLYVIGADRLRGEHDASTNEILALARVVFALLWGYDAILKLHPYFLGNYLGYLTDAQASAGATTWQGAYLQLWITVSQTIGPILVAALVGVAEAAVALGLLFGRGLRILGPIGIGLSLVIFTTAEGWGGPYSLGAAANMPMRLFGVAVIYTIALAYVWVLYNPLDLLFGRGIPSRPGTQR
jgi:hypothetical protein